MEIQPTLELLGKEFQQYDIERFKNGDQCLDVLITGIGGPALAYHLTRRLAGRKYQGVLQAGIAGSFRENYIPGETLAVKRDCFADLGAEDGTGWYSSFELGWQDPGQAPFLRGFLENPLSGAASRLTLPWGKGISLNTVTGNPKTRDDLIRRFDPDLESMEGAAFHYICLHEQIPFLQLRSISNRVGVRDHRQWNRKDALENLNDHLQSLAVPLLEKGLWI